MPEECQIQNATVVQIQQQSHQMGFSKRFICEVHWMRAWKNSEGSDKQRRGVHHCRLFRSPESEFYLSTHQLSLPFSKPYTFTKAGPMSFVKSLNDHSAGGPVYSLFYFKEVLPSSIIVDSHLLNRLQAKLCVSCFDYFPGKSALMGHSKQRLGLFVPIQAVITQEAFLKQGTKNS